MAAAAKTKTATCISRVPAILSPTRQEITIGAQVEYSKIIFRNGEHHLKLASGGQVPAVFFQA